MAELLKKGADPNARDDEGWTPLESALEAARWADGDWEIVEALLEGGADPIQCDGNNLLSDDILRKCFAEVLTRAKERWFGTATGPKMGPAGRTGAEPEKAGSEEVKRGGR